VTVIAIRIDRHAKRVHVAWDTGVGSADGVVWRERDKIHELPDGGVAESEFGRLSVALDWRARELQYPGSMAQEWPL